MFWSKFLLKTAFKMTELSMLMRLQGLRPEARVPTCPLPCYATESIG